MTALAATVRTERPAPKLPAGWRCSTDPESTREQWTWSQAGVPLVSVGVSLSGEMSPPMMRRPDCYWMAPTLLRACAEALDALAQYIGARGPR